MSRANSARAWAAHTLAAVLAEDITLDAALERVLGAVPVELHAAVRSLAYGAVRGYFRHEALLSHLLRKPLPASAHLPRALLSVALFELEDANTPQYAVVDAAVDAARELRLHKLTGLINALLRRYLRERSSLDPELARSPAVRHAFPDWLAQLIRADWPVSWTRILAASDCKAPLWLRVNARQSTGASYLEELRAHGMHAHLQPEVPHAVVLEKARDVRELPGFAEGRVSVQDLGAQCVAFPLALEAGQRVLDACAAPGGKTALIDERQPDLAGLYALDLDGERVNRMQAGMTRVGCGARILCADATRPQTWWDGRPFDRILVDAPCSALGVIRRHPDIRLRRKPGDIDRFATRQLALLRALFALLATGGRLVYATCTVTRRENRDTVRELLACTPEAVVVPPGQWAGWPGWGENDEYGVQILPGEAGSDGFYYAALEKR